MNNIQYFKTTVYIQNTVKDINPNINVVIDNGSMEIIDGNHKIELISGKGKKELNLTHDEFLNIEGNYNTTFLNKLRLEMNHLQ